MRDVSSQSVGPSVNQPTRRGKQGAGKQRRGAALQQRGAKQPTTHLSLVVTAFGFQLRRHLVWWLVGGRRKDWWVIAGNPASRVCERSQKRKKGRADA